MVVFRKSPLQSTMDFLEMPNIFKLLGFQRRKCICLANSLSFRSIRPHVALLPYFVRSVPGSPAGDYISQHSCQFPNRYVLTHGNGAACTGIRLFRFLKRVPLPLFFFSFFLPGVGRGSQLQMCRWGSQDGRAERRSLGPRPSVAKIAYLNRDWNVKRQTVWREIYVVVVLQNNL